MENVYVLEIPDLQQILSHEDIAVGELFLLTDEKCYEKIHFQVSNEGGCYTFKNIEAYNGIVVTVQIDFDNKKILFHPGNTDSREFEDFLLDILYQLFVRVEKNRIQFLSSSRNQWRKKIKPRR